MSIAAPAPEIEPVTSTDLIAAVRAQRRAADRAEARILQLAVCWAHAHPALPGDESWHAPRATVYDDGALDPTRASDEELEWFGIPEVAWDAPAAFAAAVGMSTTAGKALIRDALVLHHRLPRVQDRLLAGQVPAWRCRRIAQAVLGSPRDVVAHIDAAVAEVAHKVGPVTLDRLLDETMLRLYPEDHELAAHQALEARHVTLHHRSFDHSGLADLTIRGEWPDLSAFDTALSEVAAALAATDEVVAAQSLDVRRSIAVGVLADPARALALLTEQPAPRPRREVVLHVHLTEAGLLGVDPVAHDESGRPLLDAAVRSWCGRRDVTVSVRPVVDLNAHDHRGSGAYAVPDRLRERIVLRDRTCVFPWCTRGARYCDADHITAHADGGPTCECNLAPLCRHHHRLKTHAGWRYTPIEPGVYLWSEPHGQQFLRDRQGTLDVTRQGQLLTAVPAGTRRQPRLGGRTAN